MIACLRQLSASKLFFCRQQAGLCVFGLCGYGGTKVPLLAKRKGMMNSALQPILWYPRGRRSGRGTNMRA